MLIIKIKTSLLRMVIGIGCLCAFSTVYAKDLDDRAADILDRLPGIWSFTLGSTTGTRVLKTLYPGSVVEWSEGFDGRDIKGKGFIGYDSKQEVFFSMTVHNGAGDYGFMTGRLKPTKDIIEFEPIHLSPGSVSFKSIFQFTSPDNFTYTAVEQDEDGNWSQSWVAKFEKQR